MRGGKGQSHFGVLQVGPGTARRTTTVFVGSRGLVRAILCIDHRQCPMECVIGSLQQVNIPSCLAGYRCNVIVGYSHKKVVERRRLGKRLLFVMRNAIVACMY